MCGRAPAECACACACMCVCVCVRANLKENGSVTHSLWDKLVLSKVMNYSLYTRVNDSKAPPRVNPEP